MKSEIVGCMHYSCRRV